MKKDYLKPEIVALDIEVSTVMMAESANTGMDETPARPDARERRGEWGDLWQ